MSSETNLVLQLFDKNPYKMNQIQFLLGHLLALLLLGTLPIVWAFSLGLKIGLFTA